MESGWCIERLIRGTGCGLKFRKEYLQARGMSRKAMNCQVANKYHCGNAI